MLDYDRKFLNILCKTIVTMVMPIHTRMSVSTVSPPPYVVFGLIPYMTEAHVIGSFLMCLIVKVLCSVELVYTILQFLVVVNTLSKFFRIACKKV